MSRPDGPTCFLANESLQRMASFFRGYFGLVKGACFPEIALSCPKHLCFPTKSFPSYSFHVSTVQLDVCQGKCMWWFREVERQHRCLVENVSIMTSRLFHLYRCIKFVCLFIFQIKIHFRFVRHWLWLNRVTAAFSPNVSFLKKEQNWSFICCMMGDDLTRWTEAPPGLTALATISYHCGC